MRDSNPLHGRVECIPTATRHGGGKGPHYNTRMRPANWPGRDLLTGGLFAAVVFLFVFWRYPFDGMTLSDSWFFYANDGGPFRWYNNASLAGQNGTNPYELSAYHPSWSTWISNRGLIPIVAWGLSLIPVEHRQVGTNILAVAVQLLNLGLFGLIVAKWSGARLALPCMICAVLYPFAAGSHFWQFLLINNLAATGFLVAVLAFVTIDHQAQTLSPRTAVLGVVTVVSFWASLIMVSYAIFMGPLFLYLGLVLANGRQTVIRFRRILTPGVVIAGVAITLNLAAIVLFSGDVPSFLAYSTRYQELGAKIGVPWQLVAAGAALGNGGLTFFSAVVSNTIGLVVYPLLLVTRDAAVFIESPGSIVATLAIAMTGTFLLSSSTRRVPPLDLGNHGGLWAAAVVWAVLAYLPFMTGFGYPRVVGLMADRVNILASWGVCLLVGLLLTRLAVRVEARSGPLFRVVLCGVLALWLANLHIQKAYYVEAYQKERQVVQAALTSHDIRGGSDRLPIVLLRRAVTVKYPRERLMAALESGSTVQKTRAGLVFFFRRHFVDEYTTSSFDLGGLMLFGCCPQTAFMAADGYARLQQTARVPLFKDEPPLRVEQDDGEYQLSYAETSVFRAAGHERIDRYPAHTHRLVWVDLDESFFRLRGRATYRVTRPKPD